MQKIYEIYSISLFNRSKNESHEYLVSGDEREITKLCKKMSEFTNSSIKDYYDFRPVEFEINDNTDEMYIVRSVNKNALNDFDPEYDRLNTISFVKC